LLLAAIALSAFASSSAWANEWLVDGASVPFTAKADTELSGTMDIADTRFGLAFECVINGLALLWEKFGEIDEFKAASCKIVKGACGSPTMAFNHLPWELEVESNSEAFKLKFSAGTKAPSIQIACNGFIEDTCTWESLTPTAENMPLETPADVLTIFNQGSTGTCTVGGLSSGELAGDLLVAALEGLRLELS